MKLYLKTLVLSILMSPLCLCANNEPDSMIVYDSSSAATYKEIYDYDATGKRSLIKGYKKNAGDWAQDNEVNYTYDVNGNISGKSGSFSLDGTSNLIPVYKYNFLYDASGFFVSDEYLSKAANESVLKGVSKHLYVYNGDKIEEVVKYTWDSKSNDWAYSEKYIYAYDAKGNQVLAEVYSFYLRNNVWQTVRKEEKSYSADNKLQVETYYENNNSREGWKNLSKTEYEYSGDILQNKVTYTTQSGDDWINNSRYTYTYTGSDLNKVSIEFWDQATGNWAQSGQDVYVYDNNKLAGVNSQLWNKGKNLWVNSQVKNYAYPGNFSIEETVSMFDPKGKMLGTYKSETEKDEDGNLLLSRTSQWNDIKQLWVPTDSEIYSYDSSNLVSSEKYSLYNQSLESYFKATYDYFTSDYLVKEDLYSWNKNSADWDKVQTIRYFYEGVETGIDNEKDDNKDSRIKIWSKSGILHIDTDEPVKLVNVYSLVGKMLYNGTANEISTMGWGEGAYIVNVKTAKGITKSEKVIVK
ncbi:T9SS type A sorting domain-containing protein [Dysgonomonas sp. 520]|uniref:T9SS type A sorting domain-containing protein n=1 Tax=Dysgonomonas sp. 520 TaxID=2302931 RepID=UPI0013D1C11B|nr:T9SS type A sorting domain-containing protein [Dysgonomonas sp. 520]NDW08931.1 T9SS C-terminal target domain-containing protein [Dysgonomonas sp. 520]